MLSDVKELFFITLVFRFLGLHKGEEEMGSVCSGFKEKSILCFLLMAVWEAVSRVTTAAVPLHSWAEQRRVKRAQSIKRKETINSCK